MSRTGIAIMIGGILGLFVGVVVIAAFLLGGGLFTITNAETTFETPPPVVVVATPTAETSLPTPTAEPTSAETTEPTVEPTATTTRQAPTAAPTENIVVSTTQVEYIQAQSDVNIRSGPGTGYSAVGYLASGQFARVTGVHTPTGWWRVICPDNTFGSCWVTGNAQFTKPENPPGQQPAATPTSTACTDIAALVADVTVPDNSRFAPNTGFNKTWRIRNAGTCTWNNSYQVVHAGGHLMGALASAFPLNQTVAPGQTADISISMVSPAASNTYQSDWKLKNDRGLVFGLGENGRSFFVKIIVSTPADDVTISGLVFQDWNENGVYDNGEGVMGSREIWLIPGTACHVTVDRVTAVAYSGSDGVYTFKGSYSGDYCVGLAGGDGLDDVRAVSVSPGQVLTGVNLRSLVLSSSISGFVWDDFCLATERISSWEGNCVPGGNGGFKADGMIQPTEDYISGVTVHLQPGACGNNQAAAVTAVTDNSGRYLFSNLLPGTYCVSINATAFGNQYIFLPGIWTFPQNNTGYHQLTIGAGEYLYAINFGWDYQLK